MSELSGRLDRLREIHRHHRCSESCQECDEVDETLHLIQSEILELLARVPPASDTTPAHITLTAS